MLLAKWSLGHLWREWCWSWNSSTLATSCEELTHWKRLWCWEGLRVGGKGDDKGWDGWMASPTRWMVSSSELWEMVMDREAWHATIHGVAKSRTRLSDWTELNWNKNYFTLLSVTATYRVAKSQTWLSDSTELNWTENSSKNSRKTSTSASLTMLKPLTVYHNKVWKILKEMGIPDHLTCVVRNLNVS